MVDPLIDMIYKIKKYTSLLKIFKHLFNEFIVQGFGLGKFWL